jgi:hypothetical protein
MAPQRPSGTLTPHGSGSRPQTLKPTGAASCGQCALAFYQGHPLLRALILPALAA